MNGASQEAESTLSEERAVHEDESEPSMREHQWSEPQRAPKRVSHHREYHCERTTLQESTKHDE